MELSSKLKAAKPRVGSMQNRKIVITGEIASGKSTVSKFIRKCGYPVFDADFYAKKIMESPEISGEIFDKFGIYYGTKEFKTEMFKNEELRDFVDRVVYKELYTFFSNVNCGTVFFEIPLYFESIDAARKSKFIPDCVLYVSANKNIRHRRMRCVRNMTKREILEREKYFLDANYKEDMSDYVIKNCGSMNLLIKNTRKFLDEEIKKAY